MFHADLPHCKRASGRRKEMGPRSLRLEILESRTLLTLQGNSLFPADNPWNAKITTANSAQGKVRAPHTTQTMVLN